MVNEDAGNKSCQVIDDVDPASEELIFVYGQRARAAGVPKCLNPYRHGLLGPIWDKGWDALQSTSGS